MRKKGITNRRPKVCKPKPPTHKYVMIKLAVQWCAPQKPEVGCVIEHPKHGLVYITDGAMWIDGRLSNHWSWRKVRRNVLTGPTHHGYGTEFSPD